MWRNVLFVLAAAGCLLPAGCGGGARKTAVRYRIAVIPKGLTHEFWMSIHRGAKRAAADLTEAGVPVEILWDGPRRESDARDQIALVQQMAGMDVQGLVLAPQHSEALVPVVKEITDSKIPVVIIDSGLDDPSLYVKYVATDNYNGGRMAARRLLDVLAKKGKTAPKLVLFRYAVGSESTEQREKGFLDEVKAAAEKQKAAGKPAAEVISDNVFAGATVDSAQKEAGPLIGLVKDKADGIFAVNESAATGMLNVLRSQDLNKKITLVAFDSSAPLLQAVREGDVEGLIVQDPYRMGYLGVWTLVRHLEGDDVTREVKGDKVEEIGNYLATGEYLLTRENVDDQATRERFVEALQAKRTIEVPKFPKRQ